MQTNRSTHTPSRRSPRCSVASNGRKRAGGSGRARSKRKPNHASSSLRHISIRLGWMAVTALVCYLVYIYVVAPYTSRWQALYGNEVYPEGYSIRGIDISHHQGTIDWQQLAKAQIGEQAICFVFVKATEGKSFLDENFNDNFYQAREYGFLRGAYHYFKPLVPAREQAEYFLRQAHLEEGDLPPVLDIEETGGLSAAQLRKAALEWLKRVEKAYGVPPILYTNYKFRLSYLNTPEFDRYPYWIAHYYVRSLTYKGAWKFWQHTDCGRLPGIKEKVDLNIYNGSMYDLRRLCLE